MMVQENTEPGGSVQPGPARNTATVTGNAGAAPIPRPATAAGQTGRDIPGPLPGPSETINPGSLGADHSDDIAVSAPHTTENIISFPARLKTQSNTVKTGTRTGKTAGTTQLPGAAKTAAGTAKTTGTAAGTTKTPLAFKTTLAPETTKTSKTFASTPGVKTLRTGKTLLNGKNGGPVVQSLSQPAVRHKLNLKPVPEIVKPVPATTKASTMNINGFLAFSHIPF